MTNERKLELTLCGMLPYGLKIQSKRHFCKYGEETLLQLNGMAFQDSLDSWKMEFIYDDDLKFEEVKNTKFKPLLHSLDKITEPILDGGLIPIVELAKILIPGLNWKLLRGAAWTEAKKGGYLLWFSIEDNCFIFEKDGIKFPMDGHLELFEKLKEWHFNIYDLPSDMYIEKSTVKI